MKLYSSKLSSNAKRVRVCIEELGARVQLQEIDFAKGENRSPEYLALNPMGKVPTFVDDDGYTLWESPAILVYLAGKHPEKKLVPSEARKQADVFRWMFWNANHFSPAVEGILLEKVIKPMRKLEPNPAAIEASMRDVARYAPVLDAQLQGNGWILGQDYTLADISVGVSVELAGVLGCNLAQWPQLQAWVGRLQARDAWKRAAG